MTNEHWAKGNNPQEGILDIQLSFTDASIATPRSLESIVKRDDRVEQFDTHKIAEAIFHAARSVGGEDESLARSLASSVTMYLSNQSRTKPLHVEHVDAAVERVLVEMGHERTALSYVQHRNKHLQRKQLQDGDARAVRDALAQWRWNRRVAEPKFSATDCIANQLENFSVPQELREEVQVSILVALESLKLKKPSSELVTELARSVLSDRGLVDDDWSLAQLGLELSVVENSFVGPFPDPDLLSTPASSDRVLASYAKESYALRKLFSADIANAHARGDLHIHDLGSIDRLSSISLHPDCIKSFGPLASFSRDEIPPARKINALIEDIASSTQILTRYCTNFVQWEAVNYSLAPYLVEFDEEALHEVSELLILSLMDQHEGVSTCATKLNIAWDVPHYLQGIEAIGPNGAMTGKGYEWYHKTAHNFAHSLLQVFREVSERFETLHLPLPVVTFPTSSDDNVSTLAFTNKVALCALVLDDLEVQYDHDLPLLPFHNETLQPREIFAQVATLNLARLGYAAHDGLEFWQGLDRLFDIACLAFVEKRAFLKTLMSRKAIGTYSHFSLQHNGRPFADMSVAEYGLSLCGLDECVRALRQTTAFDDIEYDVLASAILCRLDAQCVEVLGQKNLRVSIRVGESDSIAERLSRIDIAHFHDTARTVSCMSKGETYAYATNISVADIGTPYQTFEAKLDSTRRYHDWIQGAVALRRPNADATFPEQLAQTLGRFFQQQPGISLHLHS